MTKVKPDYQALIKFLGGKDCNVWKEKSKEMAAALTEMNQKEACESQVVHNMQAQNMLSSKMSGRSL